MGKAKKGSHHRNKKQPSSDRHHRSKKSKSASLPPSLKKAKSKASKPQEQQQQKQQKQQQHNIIIPFEPENRILLLGEGDFSFSRSLLEHHAIVRLHATCPDARSGVLSKYPQAATHLKLIEAQDSCKVEYGVDATKLGRAGGGGGGNEVRKGGWDRIVFNFPHVGGLTKDVNRQVRANQELLVAFFKSATALLTPKGQIVLTIFEGEPYELWNVRDLGRHAGLKVNRSFRFDALAYPGYRHARTLGNIDGGGGWKGENRPARTYLFELKDNEQPNEPGKRTKDQGDSDSD